MRKGIFLYLFFTYCIFSLWPAQAQWQMTLREFGQNRVQYKPFDWFYVSTRNFDVYYYRDGYQNALNAIELAENSFQRITEVIGYYPYSKTKVYLFNSTADVYQSNLGIHHTNYAVGKITVSSKSQVQVVYTGSTTTFRKELDYALSKLFITDLLLGNNWREILQGSVVPSFSDWFIEGAALYVAEGWSIEMDDYMREKLAHGKLKKIFKLKGKEAALVGQSVWNFIAEKYGKGTIANILGLTRIIKKEETSIETTLGIPYAVFLEEWKAYYLSLQNNVSKSEDRWPDPSTILFKNKKKFSLGELKFNLSGDRLAYVESRKSRYKVRLYDLSTQKTRTILRGKALTTYSYPDHNNVLISWRSNQDLGIIHSSKGKMLLSVYEESRHKVIKKSLAEKFTQVLSFSYSSDGKTLLASVNRFGKTDIYIYDIPRNALTPITNDDYDDLYPSFIPGTNAIVFASNRVNDTLRTENISPNVLDENFNIFIYSPDSVNKVLKRITNTVAEETKPLPISSKEILYLSNQTGIVNLYSYSLDKNKMSQLTAYLSSIDDYSVQGFGKQFAFTSFNKGRKEIFLQDHYDQNLTQFSPYTPRQEQLQLRFLIQQKHNEKIESKEIYLKTKDNIPVVPLKINPTQDTIVHSNASKEINTDDYQFNNSKASSIASDTTKTVNTENYQFESSPSVITKLTKTDSMKNDFLKLYKKVKKGITIRGAYPYKPLFTVINFNSALLAHPIKGLGTHIQLEMSDILENHKLYGGMVMLFDFKSGSVYAEYQYLKHRLDYKVRFERRGLYLTSQPITIQKYTLHQLEAGISYPFDNYTRLSLTPFLASTYFNDLSINTLVSPYPSTWPSSTATTFYSGLKAELVLDRTTIQGLNLVEGTKAQIKIENYSPFNNSNGFTKFRTDIRHYQNIYREMIFATRLIYGKFIGNNAPNFIVGGMDNWILKKDDQSASAERNPLAITNLYDNRNILFAEYVTNLRGFNYNKVHGTDALVVNAEWRFPVFHFLSSRPIKSNFLRHFQITTFFDIGTSWTGQSPFSQESSINLETIGSVNSPFKAIVKNYKNPFLMGYGTGIRTMISGYFLKLDLAWGVEDFVTKSPKLYLTISEDF